MNKKLPLRKCIVCGQIKEKSQMTRIVKQEDGIRADFTGRANGRGAYVCGDPECLTGLWKRKALDRTFKTRVPEETYVKIAEEIRAHG